MGLLPFFDASSINIFVVSALVECGMVVPSCALINLYGAAVDPGSDTITGIF